MIKTPGEWAVKKLVRERDGNTCKECGMSNAECQTAYGRGLHVHRIVPGSRYTVDGCTLLCKRCHNLAHGHEKLTVPTGSFPPPKPSTQPRQFRLTDQDMADLDAIGKAWRPLFPLGRTDVIREMIRRTKAEIGPKKKS